MLLTGTNDPLRVLIVLSCGIAMIAKSISAKGELKSVFACGSAYDETEWTFEDAVILFNKRK